MNEWDVAYMKAEDEIKALEKKYASVYAQAHKEVTEKAEAYFKGFEKRDKAKREMVKRGLMTDREYKRWRVNQMLMGDRWIALRDEIAASYTEANKLASEAVIGVLPVVYAENYNYSNYVISRLTKPDMSFTIHDRHTVDRLIKEEPNILPYKKVDGKKVERWNRKKVSAAITQSVIQGESIPSVAKRLRIVTDMNRRSSVRNARTAVTSAQNAGRIASYRDAEKMGIKVSKQWLATLDGRTRHQHRELDGQVVPNNEPFENGFGEIMYPGDPEAAPANVYNCFVGETNIATDSEVIRSYKHNYSGRFVTVKTAGGVNFTCTPNHPILTIGGWVPAESLQKGNDILVAFRRNDVFGRINPNINHVFPRIDAIHDFLNMSGGKRATSKMVNFHGDIPASDVEIITQKWFLGSDWNTSGSNSVDKFLLKHANKTFMGKSALVKHFGRIGFAALGFVGGVSKSLPFFFTGLRHPEIHRLRPIALLYSGRVKPLDNDVARNAELISECLDGFSGFVFADNIVSVDFSSGCSHVYNLQTENGYYFVNSSIAQSKRKSNGIFAIAHNCRCALIPAIDGHAIDLSERVVGTGEDYESWKEAMR